MPEEQQETVKDEEKISKKEAKAAAKKEKKTKEDELKETIDKLNADVAHWKNEYYKAYADTMNLRKSLEEDKNRAIRYRSEGFLSELIPALDAYHLALASPAPSQEVANYLVGFTYIYNQLTKALQDEGVSFLEPKIGEPFDEQTMHAMEAVVVEDAKPGTVVKVLTKGYKLHDKLIKPALVNVAKAKEEKKDEAKEEPLDESAKA